MENMYGSPDAMKLMDAYYDYMTREYRLDPKPVLEGLSRGALFAFLRRLTHPIRTKALREKSTAEARPQRAGDGGSPAQETAERTLLSRERNAQASMGAGGDRYIAMACQSRKSGPQVVRAS